MFRIKKIVVYLIYILIGSGQFYTQDLQFGSVIDVEGTVYRTVFLGKYEWMTENLRTTTYNDGIEIPVVKDDSVWVSLKSGACCWFNNKNENAPKFGALYNWYAVETKKLAPEGWRIPSDEEWKYLEGYVDTYYKVGNDVWNKTGSRGLDAGKKLKSESCWNTDGNGTNNYEFSALPGGERLLRNGEYFILGSNGFWWTSTESGSEEAWFRIIIYAFDDVIRSTHNKGHGFSVRCIRDR